MDRVLTLLKILVLSGIAGLAIGADYAISSGKLLDFTEERYNRFHPLEPGGSCVNRDYTVDAGDRVLVIRHETCMPHRDPALKLVIGRKIQFIEDQKRDRIAILDAKGKAHWYRLFKEIEKPKEVK